MLCHGGYAKTGVPYILHNFTSINCVIAQFRQTQQSKMHLVVIECLLMPTCLHKSRDNVRNGLNIVQHLHVYVCMSITALCEQLHVTETTSTVSVSIVPAEPQEAQNEVVFRKRH